MRGEKEEEKACIEYSALEIFQELIAEKKGEKATDDAQVEKRSRMKEFLKQSMKTD